MAETNKNQQRKWPRYFYLLVPLVVALLTMVMIELLLILFWPVPPSMAMNMYYKVDPHTGFAHEPAAIGRYPNGIPAVANSNGFRDDEITLEKPPNMRRILMLGDSFTVGVNVEMDEAYPQVLERLMNKGSSKNVEIVNAALGGSAPFQYAQYFEHHGSEFSPDVVMVGFFVGNDTYDTVASIDKTSTVVNGQRVSREAAEGRFVQFRILLHQHLNLLRLLQGTSFIEVTANRKDCEDFTDFLLETGRNRLKNHRVDLNERPEFSVNAVNQIERIKQDADRMGIELVVILIPDELQINEKLRTRLLSQDEQHTYDFAMPQKMLIDEFAKRSITTFDLLPFFLQDQRCLYMNDTHWTAEGHAVAASAIAQYMSNPNSRQRSVPATASRPDPKPADAPPIPLQETVKIIQTYAAVLQESTGHGAIVIDSSQLPFPKDQIKAAAMTLNSVATDPAEKASFLNIAKSLALFQPDVGDTPISLEEVRSDGTAWRSIVEPEMVDIERTFSQAKRPR